MERSVRTGLEAKEGRKFGLTVGIAFGLLAAFLLWREHMLVARIFGGIGGALVLGGLLIPRQLKPVERGWMWMAHQISKVTTPIVMGIVYFLVVTPIGLGFRILKGNPLVHSADAQNGYWVSREQPDAAEIDMRRQF